MDEILIQDAIHKHGAHAVYDAACRHMAGTTPDLNSVGISPASLRDVLDVQSHAYAQLGEARKAIENAKTLAELDSIAKRHLK